MNERLKELLGQAYDEAVPETWTTLSSEQLGRIYDKFAELIVRECAQFIFVLDAEPVSHKSAARMLQEHFGVEE